MRVRPVLRCFTAHYSLASLQQQSSLPPQDSERQTSAKHVALATMLLFWSGGRRNRTTASLHWLLFPSHLLVPPLFKKFSSHFLHPCLLRVTNYWCLWTFSLCSLGFLLAGKKWKTSLLSFLPLIKYLHSWIVSEVEGITESFLFLQELFHCYFP